MPHVANHLLVTAANFTMDGYVSLINCHITFCRLTAKQLGSFPAERLFSNLTQIVKADSDQCLP